MPAYDRLVNGYGPVGYWFLTSVQTDRDRTSGAHNAAFTNGGTTAHMTKSIVRSMSQRSINDQSGNIYWLVNSFAALNQSAFTVALWFRSTSASRMTLVGRDSGGAERPFFFGVKATGNFELIDTGSTHAFNGTRTDLADGRVHLIGFYYTNNLVEFWCDGALDSSQAGATAPATTGSTNMYLGKHETAGFTMAGTIAHVAYFPSRLLEADWKALYRVGAATIAKPSV